MNKIETYIHKVQYYETDQMKIVHHSNYIRWFEEARVDFLDQIGLSYFSLEEMGIASPVLGIECNYQSMVRFGDAVKIYCTIDTFTGVKFSVKYKIVDAKDETLRATGSSKHCFINSEGKPIHLKRENDEAYSIFKNLVDNKKQD
ncbi:MAG: acyl-CoA thioesterase [Coprobacillaceae bacterium]